MTLKDFITKAREIHGNKYDYSKVDYVNGSIKVCIIDPEYGEFWQKPNDHLNVVVNMFLQQKNGLQRLVWFMAISMTIQRWSMWIAIQRFVLLIPSMESFCKRLQIIFLAWDVLNVNRLRLINLNKQ